jgi:hypothetical protein
MESTYLVEIDLFQEFCYLCLFRGDHTCSIPQVVQNDPKMCGVPVNEDTPLQNVMVKELSKVSKLRT